MKLNFSIDVILGHCLHKSDEDQKENSSKEQSFQSKSNREEIDLDSQRNHTVEWWPSPTVSSSASSSPNKSHIIKRSTSSSFLKGSDNSHFRLVTSITPQFSNNFAFSNNFFDSSTNYPIRTSYNAAPYHFKCNAIPNSSSIIFKETANSASKPSQKKVLKKVSNSNKENTSATSNPTTSSSFLTTNQNRKIRKPLRRSRVGRRLFTGNQILELEHTFTEKQYLNRTERMKLAEKIKLTECQIKTWFQNRRTKEKRRGPYFEKGDVMETNETITFDDVNSSEASFQKQINIPGYGVQVRPTYGPPDKYLKAAILDYIKRNNADPVTVT